MRKFWKIENNSNVRKSETLKSRKLVKPKIGKIRSERKPPHRNPWRTRTEDMCVALKNERGIMVVKSILAEFGYQKLSQISDENLTAIRHAAFNALKKPYPR